jgi:hypothetical protein
MYSSPVLDRGAVNTETTFMTRKVISRRLMSSVVRLPKPRPSNSVRTENEIVSDQTKHT